LKQVPPNERICRNCGKPLIRRIGTGFEKIDKRRMYYCTNLCRAEWYAKTSLPALRDKVLARDNYTCQKCGRKEGMVIGYEEKRGPLGNLPPVKVPIFLTMEVHHIIPIQRGGNEFDPDNCTTLCIDCHKKATGRHNRFSYLQKGQTQLAVSHSPKAKEG